MLTTSEEPFGLGHLYKGLCRYRYWCIDLEHEYGRENNSRVGPPVRVFRQGSPEFCQNIECYSTEEFPLKNIAIDCGIVGYWALPLLKRDAQLQHCVGVLECLSFNSASTVVNYFDPVFSALEDLDLACPSLHSHECNKVSGGFVSGSEVQLVISSEQPPTLEDNVENCQSSATARIKHSILTHHPNTQNRAVISEEVFTKPQITLDALEPYIGGNLAAAQKEFKVSRSTLKRRCRELGIHRWPSHKRNKVDHVPRFPASSVKGGEVIQEFEIGRCPNNNATEKGAAAADSIPTSAKAKSIDTGDRSDLSYSMTVKATYKDDIVKFPLCSNSEIEELRRELDKRFELKAETERFKIKYEDESEWILMSCDEDLRFGMDTLKSSGQTRMNLLVLSATL